MFSLKGKTAVITGAAGLLGCKHAEILLEVGANTILLDINQDRLVQTVTKLNTKFVGSRASSYEVDITDQFALTELLGEIKTQTSSIDILINNAANNPKVEDGNSSWSRVENFPVDIWDKDLEVGLKGAFLCSRLFGCHFAQNGGGIILNISSDLGVIAPDQRIYRQDDLSDDMQPVKPVTYSVVKHGLIGLTKYLATYWADKGVRVNSLSPGGVYNGQDSDFVKRLTNLIPLGRMAHMDEYKGAVLFLCSDASSYMTGANLSMDGGRTCW